jgi:hypothetical protein
MQVRVRAQVLGSAPERVQVTAAVPLPGPDLGPTRPRRIPQRAKRSRKG